MEILEKSTVSNEEINALVTLCWDEHKNADYKTILKHSLSYFTVRDSKDVLIAFCNLAWDGGRHATIFDLNVHSDYRHQGLALRIMKQAKKIAIDNNIEFLHVDFDPKLEPLYKKAGFEMISAGIILL